MGQKVKFILSDLYIGAGYANRGNDLEEFMVDTELISFLCEIEQESERLQAEVELIINGNLFEFLRVPAVNDYDPTKIYPKEAYLDSSEKASVQRLKIISQGHPEVFKALSGFMQAEAPQRRITIVKGNHDVNLFWPQVKNKLRKSVKASGPRASLLLFAEDFISREKIYVEHGHQRTEAMNRYEDFLDPRHPDDSTQLYYPAGSRFFIDFCNDVDQEYPFANNVKPITTLMWYALEWDLKFAAKLLISLIHYAPDPLSINGATPEGGVKSNNLLEGLHNEADCYQILQRCADDPILKQQFYHQLHLFLNIGAAPNRLVTPSNRRIVYDPLIVGRTVQEQQRSMLHQAAEKIAEREGAQVILFGHTHHPMQERLDTGGLYINTGCWLEDFTDASPTTWHTLFNKPERLRLPPAHLPFARIDYDQDNNPLAYLLDFTAGSVQTPDKLSRLPKRLFGWVNRFISEPLI